MCGLGIGIKKGIFFNSASEKKTKKEGRWSIISLLLFTDKLSEM